MFKLGAIVAPITADISGFSKGLAQVGREVDAFGKRVSGGMQNVQKSLQKTSDSLGKAGRNLSLKVTAPLAAGMGLVSTQAFNQVKAVQNASYGLRAYEKDAKKANKVLSELVGYAQSDVGVLFQRQDLFDAASTLKIYGVETEGLTDKVKVMSKGVAVGKTTFQELSNILGRVSAAGQLTATDFDMLVARGIGLDASMRGTAVTADELFKALDDALPDEILEGRATTIEGQMIRLQSAFRNLGHMILGTNQDADGFMPGSIGDRIMRATDAIREFLRSEEFIQTMKQAIQDLNAVFDILENIVKKVTDKLKKLDENQRTNIVRFIMFAAVLGPTLILLGSLIKLLAIGIGLFMGIAKVVAFFLGVVKATALALKLLTIAKMLLFAKVLLVIGIIGALGWAIMTIIRNFGQLRAQASAAWQLLVMGAQNAWNWIRNIANSIGGAFSGMIGSIWSLGGQIFSALTSPFSRALAFIRNLFSGANIAGAIRNAIPGPLRGLIPGFASGVSQFAGGLAQINERGPELIGLPNGATVIPASLSASMMSGMQPAGAGISIGNITINNDADTDRFFRELDRRQRDEQLIG